MEPSISDAEIFACCCKLMESYGSRARSEARVRRDRLLADDDFEGYLVWSRIESKIGRLSAPGSTFDTYN